MMRNQLSGLTNFACRLAGLRAVDHAITVRAVFGGGPSGGSMDILCGIGIITGFVTTLLLHSTPPPLYDILIETGKERSSSAAVAPLGYLGAGKPHQGAVQFSFLPAQGHTQLASLRRGCLSRESPICGFRLDTGSWETLRNTSPG